MALLGIAVGLVVMCSRVAAQPPNPVGDQEAQPSIMTEERQAPSVSAQASDATGPDREGPSLAMTPVSVSDGGSAGPETPSGPPDGQQDEIIVTGHAPVRGDPLAPLNEKSFAITASVDNAVAGPVARRYNRAVPEPIRNGIRNVFANLREPRVFLNFVLQHKVGKAVETVGRFAINTTIGAAGLFDIAKRRPFRLPARPNSFPDTLGFYGMKPGVFFYVPLMGPTTLRDLTGGFVDRLLLPAGFGAPFNNLAFKASTGAVRGLNHRAEIDDQIRTLRNTPENNYDAAREFYLKRRQAEIDGLHGKRPTSMADGLADTLPPAGWIEQIWEQFDTYEDLACLSGPHSFYDLAGFGGWLSRAWFVGARPLYGITGHMMVGGNFAIRRDVLEKMGGFDDTIEFYGEDVDIAKRASKQGQVLFSPGFVMPTSGRRMKKEGFVKMARIYFLNHFSIVFRGKPATMGYRDVR